MPTPRLKSALAQRTEKRRGKEVAVYSGRLFDTDGVERKFSRRCRDVSLRVAEGDWDTFKRQHGLGGDAAPSRGRVPFGGSDNRQRYSRSDLHTSTFKDRMKLSELEAAQKAEANDPKLGMSDGKKGVVNRSWRLFWKWNKETGLNAVYVSDITAELADAFGKWVFDNTQIQRENYVVINMDAAWNKFAKGQSFEAGVLFHRGKTDRGYDCVEPNPFVDTKIMGTGAGRPKDYYRPAHIAQILKYLWTPAAQKLTFGIRKDFLWWTVFIMLLCETGCRQTEIIHLPRRQIKFGSHFTTIDLLKRDRRPIPELRALKMDWIPWATKQYNLSKRKVRVKPENLAKSLRKDIPISPTLTRLLKVYIAHLDKSPYLLLDLGVLTECNRRMRLTDKNPKNPPRGGWNFGDNGTDQTVSGIYTVYLDEIQSPAGVPEQHLRRLHEFRHTFIRRCSELGLPEHAAADLIGDSPESVGKAYRIWSQDKDHKVAWGIACPWAKADAATKKHTDLWKDPKVWDVIYKPIMAKLKRMEREEDAEPQPA